MAKCKSWQGLLVAAALAWPGLAGAQQQDAQRAAARELGYSGVESFQAGDYPTASAKLEKAYAVLKVPSLGLWSARALIKTNRWVEAAERLRQVQTLEAKGGDAPVQEQAIKDAKGELDALTPRIPRLVVEVQQAPSGELQVLLDGDAIAAALVGEEITVNPGEHKLQARVGDRSAQKSVTLAEAAKQRVTLSFAEGASEPAAPAPDGAAPASATPVPAAEPQNAAPASKPGSGHRIAGWVMLGGGTAGVAVGTVMGFMAMGLKKDLENSGDCKGTSCATRQNDAVDSYNTQRLISSIGLIGGAALATAGVVVLVTAPKAQQGKRGPALWLRVSSSQAELGGSF